MFQKRGKINAMRQPLGRGSFKSLKLNNGIQMSKVWFNVEYFYLRNYFNYYSISFCNWTMISFYVTSLENFYYKSRVFQWDEIDNFLNKLGR